MQPVRILFLDYTNGIGLGGGQRSLALLLRHLPRDRYEPLVACPPGEQLREILPVGVPLLDLTLSPAFTSASRFSALPTAYGKAVATSLASVRNLRRLLVSERIGLIHANNFKMHLLAALASTGLKVPVLWHVRDIFPSQTAGLLRAASLAASRVLTVSRAVAAQFKGCSNVSVVYNAVELPDAAALEPSPAVTDSAQTTIGYVGRLDSGKGLDTLIEAFLGLVAEFPHSRLLLAGEGPERKNIPSHPAIEILGFQNDLAPVWRQMDLCVQPSSLPDSFPRSVIEAMSWAKPVVGAGIGGIPEAIEEGTTGLLFQPGDATGLKTRLQTLLRHPVRARAMGLAGRRRCERLFSVGAQMEQLNSIYESTTHAICHS